jgi:hypothetical protein
MTDEEKNQIKQSLEAFGMVEPIVVNNAPERMNIVIGGHQRLVVCKELGKTEMPVVYVTIPELDREKTLNLRLNRNQGHWEWDKLMNEFEKDMLLGVGFTEIEIGDWNPDEKEHAKPPENDDGLMVMLKIKCPTETKDALLGELETMLVQFEGAEIVP